MLEALFGSETAERVLLFLQVYEDGYGREIAATYGLPHNAVQNQLRKLEQGGLLVSSTEGRTRIYRWNPRNPFIPPLRVLLKSVVGALPESTQARYYRRRTRPRRAGKPL
jgi:DNA-binding transcriptional ArsR family regulator